LRVDYAHEGNYLISCTGNISADGIFVCTEAPPPVGTVVQLVFSVGELNEVAVAARVAWVGPPGGASEAGMGLRFLDPPAPLREAILELVHRVAILDEEVAPAACPPEHAAGPPPIAFPTSRKPRLPS
jgi:uncharacterized protein (TIGR02266 family)